MLTRGTKAGLALAFLLGLSDIAILGALTDDDPPPVGIVILSVGVGLATLILVLLAWRSVSRALVLAIVGLRAVSGLGDVMAFGEDAVVVTVSTVFLVITLLDIYLLRSWLRARPVPPAEPALT